LEESGRAAGDEKMRIKLILVFTLVLMLLCAMASVIVRPINAQAQYSVTIWGWDYIQGWQVPVPVIRDGVATGFSTPVTFIDLTGTHTFSVPSANSAGHPFSDWDTDWTDPTITVSSGGTYTARYRAGYSVTIWGWDYIDGWQRPVPITLDYVSTGYSTPHTFADLTGTHHFMVPTINSANHPLSDWSNDRTDPVLPVNSAGVYTARYRAGYSVTIQAETRQGLIARPITRDGTPTGFETPHTFADLAGTHTFTVPDTDAQGRPFNSWVSYSSTPPPSTTLTVSSAVDCTAFYHQGPTGSVVISGGAAYATSAAATLSLNYTGHDGAVYQVRYSNDGVWDTEGWESPAASRTWSLTSGDGTKTVYYQIKDDMYVLSPTYSDTIILDTTPPTGFIVVNNYAAYTNSTSVMLGGAYMDLGDPGSGLSGVRYSNDGVSWTAWRDVSSAGGAWTLIPGDGTKTVYLQIKDNAGLVSSTYSDTIILDTTPPTGSVVINGGAALTNSTSVTLTLTYADSGSGVSQARYSNDGTNWTSWEAPAASKAWTLILYDGQHTVYYQVKDNAGLTGTYSDTIGLDFADTTLPLAR